MFIETDEISMLYENVCRD